MMCEHCQELQARINVFEAAWNAYNSGEPLGSLHRHRWQVLENAYLDLVLPRYLKADDQLPKERKVCTGINPRHIDPDAICIACGFPARAHQEHP